MTQGRIDADTLHLGISADVTFQRALEVGGGRRSQSSGTYPLCRDPSAEASLVAPVAQDQGVWLSLRCTEPVALQVVVDGVNASDGSAFAGAFDATGADHVVLPHHRWIDGVLAADGTVAPLHGPTDDDEEIEIVLHARRLRGAAFRHWWAQSGAADRANRGPVMDVAGGRAADDEHDAANHGGGERGSASTDFADRWDPEPFDVVTVRLLTPPRWSSVTGIPAG